MSRSSSERHRVYSPIVQAAEGPENSSGLSLIGLATLGLYLHAGPLGVVAGVAIAALWTRLQAEFVFAAGVLLFVWTSGDLDPIATAVTMTGLTGLLALESAYTWDSLRPAVLFMGLVSVVWVGGFVVTGDVPLHWLGIGASLTIALLAYGLHRYETIRLEFSTASREEPAPSTEQPEAPTRDEFLPVDRRSEDT